LSRPKQKKEKIGTIFCPKGGLAVVILIMTSPSRVFDLPDFGPEKLKFFQGN
jgi:hypothetical protein